MNEIVIIGGGPVGIWTAIQLKKRSPGDHIVIYERFETYQRSHVLKLDHWSLILYSKKTNDQAEKTFIKKVTGTTLNRIRMLAAKSLFIRTNDLENALKQYASDLCIEIKYQKISTLDEIEQLHPNCTQFIAADGANSPLRNQLLGNDSIDKRALQHIVEFKYSVSNKTSAINLKDVLKVNNQTKFMAFEYIGRFRKSTTPVSVRFFINEETYEKIPGATFKKPLSLEELYSNTDITDLADSVKTYLNYRKETFGDNIIDNSVNISKLPLNIYSAKQFAVEHNNRNWYLVGDAALGVPYFRALNSGLILGSMLANILNTNLNINNSRDFERNAYNVHRVLHINTEFEIAKSKNFLLNIFENLRHLDVFQAKEIDYSGV